MANGDSSPDYDTAQPVPLDDLVYRQPPPGTPPMRPLPMPSWPGAGPPQTQNLPNPAQPDAGPEPQGPQDWDRQLGQRYGTAPMGIAAPWNRPGPMPQQMPPQISPLADFIRQFSPTPYRQPYRPASTFGRGSWGQRPWSISAAGFYPGQMIGPGLPSSREALQITSNAGRLLSMFGSNNVGQLAGQASQLAQQFAPLLDLISGGKFSANFLRARLGNMRLLEEEMNLKREQAVEKHREEMLAYNEIFDQFRAGIIDHEQAKMRIRELGHDNPTLMAWLDNKDLAGVEHYLNWYDRQLHDMDAAHTASKKAQDEETSREYWEGGGGGDTGDVSRRPLPGAEKLAPEGGAARAAEPGTAAPEIKTADDYDAYLARKYSDPGHSMDPNSSAVKAQRRLARGEEVPEIAKSKEAGKIGAMAMETQGNIERVLNNENLSTDDKRKELAKYDPQLPGILDRIGTYHISPKSFRANPKDNLLRWVTGLHPDYDESQFDAVKKMENPTSPEHNMMVRANELPAAAARVIREVNKLPKNEKIPRRLFETLQAKWWDGDDKFTNLWTAMQSYATISSALASGTGTARVGIQGRMLAEFHPWSSPNQVIGTLEADAVGAREAVKARNEEWWKLRPNDPQYPYAPGYREESEAKFKALMALGRLPQSDPRRQQILDALGDPTGPL